jgi:hypothetical protein
MPSPWLMPDLTVTSMVLAILLLPRRPLSPAAAGGALAVTGAMLFVLGKSDYGRLTTADNFGPGEAEGLRDGGAAKESAAVALLVSGAEKGSGSREHAMIPKTAMTKLNLAKRMQVSCSVFPSGRTAQRNYSGMSVIS